MVHMRENIIFSLDIRYRSIVSKVLVKTFSGLEKEFMILYICLFIGKGREDLLTLH